MKLNHNWRRKTKAFLLCEKIIINQSLPKRSIKNPIFYNIIKFRLMNEVERLYFARRLLPFDHPEHVKARKEVYKEYEECEKIEEFYENKYKLKETKLTIPQVRELYKKICKIHNLTLPMLEITNEVFPYYRWDCGWIFLYKETHIFHIIHELAHYYVNVMDIHGIKKHDGKDHGKVFLEAEKILFETLVENNFHKEYIKETRQACKRKYF